MKTAPLSLARPLAAALLVLTALIATSALIHPAKASLGEERPGKLRDYERLLFFLQGFNLAKGELPDPAARWPRAAQDPACFPVGHGIWRAFGDIEIPASGQTRHLTWEIYFVPSESGPRYLRVGDCQWGDRDDALKAARDVPFVVGTSHE